MKTSLSVSLASALATTVLLVSTLSGIAGAVVAPAAVTRPNFVVIMTDDQTAESLRVMSKTRALIGVKGVTFPNNYASYPLCCPSRATFLTG